VAYLESCIRGAIYQKQGNYVLTLDDLSSILPVLQGYEPMLKKFLSNGLFEDRDKRYFDLITRSNNICEEFVPTYNVYFYEILEEFRQIFSVLGDVSYFTKMTYFDFVASLPALLQVDDRVNGAFELESRVPLLDEDIIEFSFSVPPKYKFLGGSLKGLLRQSTLGMIPQEIVNRKDKMGFPVPFNEWMKDPMSPLRFFVLDTIGKSSIVQKVFGKKPIENFDREAWGKLSLALWEERFGVYL
jgi:asparagine synthase (glutamine-hydrolysing)